MKKILLLLPFFFSVYTVFSQYEDADDAFPVCGNQEISFDEITGVGEEDDFTPISSICTLQQNATKWLRIRILEDGNLAFIIEPQNPTDDYDFGVFGPNPDVNNLGSPIRSSYAAHQGDGRTGLRVVGVITEECEGQAGDQIVDHIEVQEGEEYLIMVDNFFQSAEAFNLQWVGSAELDCSIVVGDLGPDQDLCTGTEITLDGTSEGANTYEWFIDDTPDDGTENFEAIAGETDPTLTITDSRTGIYRLIASDSEQTVTDDVLITFVDSPEVSPVTDEVCSPSSTYAFTLSAYDNMVTEEPGVDVSYYESSTDAEEGNNALPNNYETASAILFTRAQNETGCFSVSELDLTVSEGPDVEDMTLTECGTEDEETHTFNLDEFAEEIINNNETITSIAFYASTEDAANEENPLGSTYETDVSTMYAVVDGTTDCQETIVIDLMVETVSSISIEDLQTCAEGGSTTATFNFDEVISGFQNENEDYSLSLYETEQDANGDVNALTGEYTNTSNPQTIFARQEITASDCYAIVTFDLVINTTDTFQDAVLKECSSGNEAQFLLSAAREQIVPDNSDATISYFETMADLENNENPLSDEYQTSERTIYARVTTTDGCEIVKEVQLIINATPAANDVEITECSSGSTATFNLSAVRNDIREDSSLPVTFYQSPDDADNMENEISDTYESGEGEIYARVDNQFCYSVARVVLSIQEPASLPISTIEACENGEGVALFDIHTFVTETEEALTGDVFLYETMEDAESDVNRITGIYESEGNTLFVKVIQEEPACLSIQELELNVLQAPSVLTDASIVNCEFQQDSHLFTYNSSDLSANLDYNLFRTEAEAEQNQNAIQEPYESAGDETIYLRLTSQQTGCFSISPLRLQITDLQRNTLDTTEVCYGDTYTLPDGREIIDSGVYEVENITDCSLDVYTLNFSVCDNGYCQPLLPDAFSPNADGINDELIIHDPLGCTLIIRNLMIYNRWGEKIFEKTGDDMRWNGQTNGSRAPTGMYVWSIDYDILLASGELIPSRANGTVKIIR